MKVCSGCFQNKELLLFPLNKDGKNGRGSVCKQCGKDRYHKNKQTILLQRKEKYNKNKDVLNEKRRLKYDIDPEYRARILTECRISYEKHRDKKLAYATNYQNDPNNKKRRNKNQKERLKRDPQFKISTYIRNRIGFFFKNIKDCRPDSSIEALGCSVKELVSHIESQWDPNMNWNNYGSGPEKWEIDHIRPLCSFDLTNQKEFAVACHYSNLQPLWHEDHVIKTTKDLILRSKS